MITSGGRRQKDPKGYKATISFKSEEHIARCIHVTSHVYTHGEDDFNVRKITEPRPKSDCVPKGMCGKPSWPARPHLIIYNQGEDTHEATVTKKQSPGPSCANCLRAQSRRVPPDTDHKGLESLEARSETTIDNKSPTARSYSLNAVPVPWLLQQILPESCRRISHQVQKAQTLLVGCGGGDGAGLKRDETVVIRYQSKGSVISSCL